MQRRQESIADPEPKSSKWRAVCDRLVAPLQWQMLDAPGESLAAIELN